MKPRSHVGKHGRVHQRLDVAGFLVGQIGIQHDRGQGGENPRPGPQRVVGHVEPQRGEHAVPFVLGGKNPLGDVTAAARLRARIPASPTNSRPGTRTA